jgi:hypothetical protein
MESISSPGILTANKLDERGVQKWKRKKNPASW